MCITRLAGYPTGFGFELLIMLARGGEEEDELLDPLLFGPHGHRHRHRVRPGGGELPPEFLRIGVQFADRAKAANVSGLRRDPVDPRRRGPRSGDLPGEELPGQSGGTFHGTLRAAPAQAIIRGN